MTKTLYEITIQTDKDCIYLIQSSFGKDDDSIKICIDQVDLLINLLEDAKKEMMEGKQ